MPIVETLFAKQEQWIVKEPVQPLEEIAKQFGFTRDQFKHAWRIRRCSTTSRRCATTPSEKLGVNSTPTFFVNGKKLIGDLSIDADGEGDRPLSQGQDKGFLTSSGRRPASPGSSAGDGQRKVWITPRRLLRLKGPTIHSPRRCGTPPRPGLRASE